MDADIKSSSIQLCDDSSCTNCGLCAELCKRNAIQLQDTNEGFCIPIVDHSKCIECHLCIDRCPQITPIEKNKPISAYAAWYQNIEIRRKSSSGGAFSAFAEAMLDRGGYVYGAILDERLFAKHVRATTYGGMLPMRESKYVQSNIRYIYESLKQDLDSGKKILFCGTPCQVAAIKSFAGLKSENLFTIDIVCHGVPSQMLFGAYLSSIGIIPTTGSHLSFRWTKGRSYRIAYGKKELPLDKQYYIKAFRQGYILNKTCYKCQYACNQRIGDLTIGDYWGLGKTVRFTHSKHSGISCVLVNTLKGEELFNWANAKLECEQRPIIEAVEGNHNLNHPCQKPVERDRFCRFLLGNHPYRDIIVNFPFLAPTIQDRIQKIKRMLLDNFI